jgi:hypothetical protein
MVRLVPVQTVTPTIWFVAHAVDVCPPPAQAVDASANTANRISQDQDREQNSRADDSRHLERCNCGLDFSTFVVFIISFSFC